MNLLEIILLVFLLLCVILGFLRGFVRSLAVFASYFAAIFISFLLLEPATEWAFENTDFYSNISEMCENAMDQLVDRALDTEGGILPVIGGLSTLQQAGLVEALPIPEFLKNLIMENNHNGMYEKLGARNFWDYLSKSAAYLILKVCVFFVVFIVISIVLRLLFRFLTRVSRLQGLQGLNRMTGALFGLVTGLVLVWAFFLILIPLSGTEMGMSCYNMIGESRYLATLYDNNLLLSYLSSRGG